MRFVNWLLAVALLSGFGCGGGGSNDPVAPPDNRRFIPATASHLGPHFHGRFIGDVVALDFYFGYEAGTPALTQVVFELVPPAGFTVQGVSIGSGWATFPGEVPFAIIADTVAGKFVEAGKITGGGLCSIGCTMQPQAAGDRLLLTLTGQYVGAGNYVFTADEFQTFDALRFCMDCGGGQGGVVGAGLLEPIPVGTVAIP